MDPEALLDYALFQLTPTRTRCDLVVVSEGKSEKLASGLVEPFVSHLKFAKDQIPKGGYSITLRPPKTDASWFTKATFQRFVRFVSTPEVLERFARLEKEISQTESSVQPNEFANSNVAGQANEGSVSTANGIRKQSTTSSKVKVEADGNDDDAQEENSKIRLQHLLETRKSLLRKEQAMAYARALAAGFELDYIDNLLAFSDAFGASRLRDACTDFKELYKKKHSDGLWMDELAAMEAYSQADLSFSGASGVILACESTPPGQNNMLNLQNGISSGKLMANSHLNISSDSTANQSNLDSNKDSNVPASDQIASTPAKVQMQMQWPKQIPQYMFNFQGPGQQMPPYQPYPYPTMQNAPQYYPENMHWHQNRNESRHGRASEPDHHRRKRSSRKKEKFENIEGAGFSEEQTESADSDTGTDSEVITYKQNDKKKSSKTVVIRNINYISSKRRNGESNEHSDDDSSVEDELLVDGDFLEQNVGDVMETLEMSHNRTSNKKKRGGKKSSTLVNGSADQEVDNMSEGGKGNANWDLFQNLLMREKEAENPNPIEVLNEHFTVKNSFDGETFRPSMKRRDCAEDALLFPNRMEETRSNFAGTLPCSGNNSSINKDGKWVVIEKTTFDGGICNTLSSEGDCSQVEVSKKIVPIDDSFMVRTQKSLDDRYDSQWKTDINFVHENGTPDASQKKFSVSAPHEPDDLSVVLSRDSGFESTRVSWCPEMNYGVEASFKEPVKKLSVVETDDLPEGKFPANKKSTDGRNLISDKQTRPKGFPGSLGKNRFDILSKSKKTLPTNRPMIQKSKLEKEEESRKKMEELAIQRQKRISERTAASGLTPAGSKSVTVASSKHKSQSTNPKLSSTISAKKELVPGKIKRR